MDAKTEGTAMDNRGAPRDHTLWGLGSEGGPMFLWRNGEWTQLTGAPTTPDAGHLVRLPSPGELVWNESTKQAAICNFVHLGDRRSVSVISNELSEDIKFTDWPGEWRLVDDVIREQRDLIRKLEIDRASERNRLNAKIVVMGARIIELEAEVDRLKSASVNVDAARESLERSIPDAQAERIRQLEGDLELERTKHDSEKAKMRKRFEFCLKTEEEVSKRMECTIAKDNEIARAIRREIDEYHRRYGEEIDSEDNRGYLADRCADAERTIAAIDGVMRSVTVPKSDAKEELKPTAKPDQSVHLADKLLRISRETKAFRDQHGQADIPNEDDSDIADRCRHLERTLTAIEEIARKIEVPTDLVALEWQSGKVKSLEAEVERLKIAATDAESARSRIQWLESRIEELKEARQNERERFYRTRRADTRVIAQQARKIWGARR